MNSYNFIFDIIFSPPPFRVGGKSEANDTIWLDGSFSFHVYSNKACRENPPLFRERRVL
jgi:hypothetical protein